MWRLFPKTWFSKNKISSEQTNIVDALFRRWRIWLSQALSKILRQEISSAAAVSQLQQLDSRHLLALDAALRFGTWCMESDRTPPSAVQLTPMKEPRDESEAYLFVAACNANGFVREQALVALHQYPGKLPLAAALIRTDDWVSQVAASAERLLEHLLASSEGRKLFALIDLAILLRARQRFEALPWTRLVEPALLNPERSSERWEATRTGTTRARLFAYSLIERADPDRLEAACRQAIAVPDPIIARWALTSGRITLQKNVICDLAQAGLRHPNGSVRAEALRLYAQLDPEKSISIAENSIFDSSHGVRNAAAYFLRSSIKIPVLDRWREAVDAPVDKRAYVALSALADFAEPEDVERLAPWLKHSNACFRARALRAIWRAKTPNLKEIVHSSLLDPSTMVAKEALKIGKREYGLIDRGMLYEAYVAAPSDASRKLFIRAASQLGKWESLEMYLQWFAEANETLSSALQTEIDRWRRSATHRFTPLAADAQMRLARKLAELTASRPNPTWKDLTHAVSNS